MSTWRTSGCVSADRQTISLVIDFVLTHCESWDDRSHAHVTRLDAKETQRHIINV